MSASPRHESVPLLDWGKAVASQLIVWHHLCFYGPLREVARPLAPGLFGWLGDEARQVVQLFLVMGGFLAARSLMPAAGELGSLPWRRWPALAWQRYARLARPLWLALALAVACAALARSLMDDPDTPAAPNLLQTLANGLLMHDVLGQPALSAGLWYVAIDLQLFLLLAAISTAWGALQRRGQATWAWALMGTLAAASLLMWNRMPGLDAYAPYFMGAYLLGVMAQWSRAGAKRDLGLSLIAGLGALALWLDWRSRIALAVCTALALAWGLGRHWLPRLPGQALVRWLARISYSVFLVHYPLSLLVNGLFDRLFLDRPVIGLVGLLTCWLASLGVGHLVHHWVEVPAGRRTAPTPAAKAA